MDGFHPSIRPSIHAFVRDDSSADPGPLFPPTYPFLYPPPPLLPTHSKPTHTQKNKGKIVPVRISLGLLRREMANSKARRFLVDGFPRNFDNVQVRASFLRLFGFSAQGSTDATTSLPCRRLPACLACLLA
jgi:hypothetical protein